jgi:hypothetical protein
MRGRTKTLAGQAYRSQRPESAAKIRAGKDDGAQPAVGEASVTKPSAAKGNTDCAAAGNASAARFAAFVKQEPATGEHSSRA